jgi:hypothetical protein
MIQTLKTSGSDVGVVVAGQFQPKDRFYNKNNKKRQEHFETRKDELSNAILTNQSKNIILNGFYKQALETFENNDCQYGNSINGI